MKDDDTGIIRHLEKHLGAINTGRPTSLSGAAIPFILPFHNQPVSGATTYVTLGCSSALLNQQESEPIRQEFIVICYNNYSEDHICSLLAAICEDVLASQTALAQGETLGPAGPIIEGSELEAFYCASPVYFPDTFHIYDGIEPPVVFVWLVPVTPAEAEFVNEHGSDEFEDILQERNPDLMDLNRDSVV